MRYAGGTIKAVFINSAQSVLTDLQLLQGGGKVSGDNLKKVPIQVQTPQIL